MSTGKGSEEVRIVREEEQGVRGVEKLISCIHRANRDGSLASLAEALIWRPEECQPGKSGAVALSHFLLSLARILDARERETYGHSHRVSLYAATLARAVGLPAQRITDIENAGLMHDVGKVGVPDFILLKPGPLTPAEQAVMREHPAMGWKLLKELECVGEAAEITLHHHERYDGRGYPQRLARELIPIGARILALADTLDAITTTRPYRKARSFEAARAEILAGRGTQFDPVITDSFAHTPLASWRELAETTAAGGATGEAAQAHA